MVYKEIESLLYFANVHLLLDELDMPLVRNQILDSIGLDTYEGSEVEYEVVEALECPCSLLDPIVDFAVESGKIDASKKEYLGNKIMGLLSKNPSDLADLFAVAQKRNPAKATQWLFDYCIKNNYVNMCKNSKNKHWDAKATSGKLEVTINLAKPEFSVAQVKQAQATESGYPLCGICAENEGYAPRNKQNMRTVPLTVAGQDWFMQFSPYSYFNQHIIVINKEHTPMVIDQTTITKLLDVQDHLPHYFVGSNSDLPGVGGSILGHEHFQGGHKALPMFFAKDRRVFKSAAHPLVTVSEIDWYNNAIRAVSLDRHRLIAFGNDILEKWKSYSDESVGLLSNTNGEQHHTASLCVRRDKQDRYVLEIILRSNIASKEHPHGVFHAHADKHNIKSEAIGLIEAMGLFVLPGRLDAQMDEIVGYLTKELKYTAGKLSDEMKCHEEMIDKLFKTQGSSKPSKLEATLNLKDEINATCEQILLDTAVFKQDSKGKDGLNKFFAHCGLEEKEAR